MLMNTVAILPGTFGNFRPLSLTTSTYTITWNAHYHPLVNTIMLMNTLAILGGTFGNFRPLSLTTLAASVFIETCIITWNAPYRQLVNAIMLINNLAILRGTFGNFWPLSLTTSTCVNLPRELYHYLERALSPTCERCNVNEHRRYPSGYFR